MKMKARKFKVGQYVFIDVSVKKDHWMNGIAKVKGFEGGKYVVCVTKGSRSVDYMMMESELRKTAKLDVLLHLYDLRTYESTDETRYSERALWHLLSRYRDRLPELDGYFHKAFRQCDVIRDGEHDRGHMDMVFWCLMNDATMFWEVFEEVQKRGTTRWA